MNDLLPKTVDVRGNEYSVRTDYRVILDIFNVLDDAEYSQYDKALAVLVAFYPDIDKMPQADYKEALQQCMWFIRCGDDEQSGPVQKLIDWGRDIRYIVAPINKAAGVEVRGIDYMHWWTFMGLFLEIGDCFFAQVINIRQKLASKKALDKIEREFYKKNRGVIDLRTQYTEQDNALLRGWV